MNSLFQNKLTNRQIAGILALLSIAVLSGVGLIAANNGTFEGWSAATGPAGIDETDPASRIATIPVGVSALQHVSSFDQPRTYTGTVRSAQQSEIGFELTGRLTEVRFDEGQRVSAEDVLATIDISSLNARKATIEAEIERAQHMLAELEAGARQEVVAAAEADVDAAESRLRLAHSVHQRNSNLVQSGGISRLEFDRSQFDLDAADSALESAVQRLEELQTAR
ncbi:MAG: biotin/lipoyl-binding protein, partial [Planctomycetota bacterium]